MSAKVFRQTERGKAQSPAIAEAIVAPRLVIELLAPLVDGGRWPSRAALGQPLQIDARILCDGHEQLAAQLLWYCAATRRWLALPLKHDGNDGWSAVLYPQRQGMHRLLLEAWVDSWQSYRADLAKKVAAGVDIALDLREGLQLLSATAKAESTRNRAASKRLAALLDKLGQRDDAALAEALLGEQISALVKAIDRRDFVARSAMQSIEVERVAAGFASWYEMFPRSQAVEAGRHGTFDDVIERLPAIREMGFDVLYFPPIHPIGQTHRKGRNNALTTTADDPGCPYAIGSDEGGHDAVHAELGGLPAFRRLVVAAQAHGIEIALDFAVQCSPDHPWIKQHPEWFRWRPDGSIRYAENPPKKYEDIVPVDFYAEGATPSLWLALRDIVLFWIHEGVKIFRVDNPHTKPLPFWQWMIADVRRRHPDVIFLSEAFTRPAMMYHLAKIGFTQSYTYFTWRNSRDELRDYLIELTEQAPRDFFRPHFFVNTPDINPLYLQQSGRPGFIVRATLAATLSGLWGIYSGFELCEAAPLPGREEYLDAEKYQLRPRDWRAPGNIVDVIARLNAIRGDNPALHTHLGVRFIETDNDQILYFVKRASQLHNPLLIAVSLDPFRGQESWLAFPAALLEMEAHEQFEVEELMRRQHFIWRNEHHHWYFDPAELPVAIWQVRPLADDGPVLDGGAPDHG